MKKLFGATVVRVRRPPPANTAHTDAISISAPRELIAKLVSSVRSLDTPKLIELLNLLPSANDPFTVGIIHTNLLPLAVDSGHVEAILPLLTRWSATLIESNRFYIIVSAFKYYRLAVNLQKNDIAELLIDYIATYVKTHHSAFFLHIPDSDILALLIQNHSSKVLQYINDTDSHDNNVLHYIVSNATDNPSGGMDDDSRKKVELLLQNGASITSRDTRGLTPLGCYIENSHISVKTEPDISLLTAEMKPEHLNASYHPSGTPLILAIIAQINLDAIKVLIKHGADVNQLCPENTISPVLAAIATNNIPVLQLLLQHGVSYTDKTTGAKHAPNIVFHAVTHLKDTLISNRPSEEMYSSVRTIRQIITILLDNITDENRSILNEQNFGGYSIIDFIVTTKMFYLIEEFAKKGISVNTKRIFTFLTSALDMMREHDYAVEPDSPRIFSENRNELVLTICQSLLWGLDVTKIGSDEIEYLFERLLTLDEIAFAYAQQACGIADPLQTKDQTILRIEQTLSKNSPKETSRSILGLITRTGQLVSKLEQTQSSEEYKKILLESIRFILTRLNANLIQNQSELRKDVQISHIILDSAISACLTVANYALISSILIELIQLIPIESLVHYLLKDKRPQKMEIFTIFYNLLKENPDYINQIHSSRIHSLATHLFQHSLESTKKERVAYLELTILLMSDFNSSKILDTPIIQPDISGNAENDHNNEIYFLDSLLVMDFNQFISMIYCLVLNRESQVLGRIVKKLESLYTISPVSIIALRSNILLCVINSFYFEANLGKDIKELIDFYAQTLINIGTDEITFEINLVTYLLYITEFSNNEKIIFNILSLFPDYNEKDTLYDKTINLPERRLKWLAILVNALINRSEKKIPLALYFKEITKKFEFGSVLFFISNYIKKNSGDFSKLFFMYLLSDCPDLVESHYKKDEISPLLALLDIDERLNLWISSNKHPNIYSAIRTLIFKETRKNYIIAALKDEKLLLSDYISSISAQDFDDLSHENKLLLASKNIQSVPKKILLYFLTQQETRIEDVDLLVECLKESFTIDEQIIIYNNISRNYRSSLGRLEESFNFNLMLLQSIKLSDYETARLLFREHIAKKVGPDFYRPLLKSDLAEKTLLYILSLDENEKKYFISQIALNPDFSAASFAARLINNNNKVGLEVFLPYLSEKDYRSFTMKHKTPLLDFLLERKKADEALQLITCLDDSSGKAFQNAAKSFFATFTFEDFNQEQITTLLREINKKPCMLKEALKSMPQLVKLAILNSPTLAEKMQGPLKQVLPLFSPYELFVFFEKDYFLDKYLFDNIENFSLPDFTKYLIIENKQAMLEKIIFSERFRDRFSITLLTLYELNKPLLARIISQTGAQFIIDDIQFRFDSGDFSITELFESFRNEGLTIPQAILNKFAHQRLAALWNKLVSINKNVAHSISPRLSFLLINNIVRFFHEVAHSFSLDASAIPLDLEDVDEKVTTLTNPYFEILTQYLTAWNQFILFLAKYSENSGDFSSKLLLSIEINPALENERVNIVHEKVPVVRKMLEFIDYLLSLNASVYYTGSSVDTLLIQTLFPEKKLRCSQVLDGADHDLTMVIGTQNDMNSFYTHVTEIIQNIQAYFGLSPCSPARIGEQAYGRYCNVKYYGSLIDLTLVESPSPSICSISLRNLYSPDEVGKIVLPKTNSHSANPLLQLSERQFTFLPEYSLVLCDQEIEIQIMKSRWTFVIKTLLRLSTLGIQLEEGQLSFIMKILNDKANTFFFTQVIGMYTSKVFLAIPNPFQRIAILSEAAKISANGLSLEKWIRSTISRQRPVVYHQADSQLLDKGSGTGYSFNTTPAWKSMTELRRDDSPPSYDSATGTKPQVYNTPSP